MTSSTPPTPMTGDNLVRARRTYQMQQVKSAIEEWWKQKSDTNEIDVDQAKAASRKILKQIYDIRLIDHVFNQAWQILKFDDGRKTIDKMELNSLIDNLSKLMG